MMAGSRPTITSTGDFAPASRSMISDFLRGLGAWTPMVGEIWKPIDTLTPSLPCDMQERAFALHMQERASQIEISGAQRDPETQIFRFRFFLGEFRSRWCTDGPYNQ